jgi:hypothetical protein
MTSVPAQETRRHHRRLSAHEAAQSHSNSADAGFTGNALVEEARRYIGTNPTGRGSLWCGAFMDMVLKHTGHSGGGNIAWGYSHYGTRVAGPQVGAIAVMHGHVGSSAASMPTAIRSSSRAITITPLPNRSIRAGVFPPT